MIFPGTGALVISVTPGSSRSGEVDLGQLAVGAGGQALASPLVVEVDSTAGAGLAGRP